MILLDLSSVRRLLCSWLAVGELFGRTVMLSTAIFLLTCYIQVQKTLDWLMRYLTLMMDFLGRVFSS